MTKANVAQKGEVLQFRRPPLPAGAKPQDALSQDAKALAERALAPNSRAAYAADWRHWERHCGGEPQALAAGENELANYIAALASTAARSTVQRRIAGIRRGYAERGATCPDGAALRAVCAGAARTAREAKRARPLTVDYLTALVDAMPVAGTAALRDRALLLVAWQAALRRAEVAALTWQDYADAPTGALITLRASKHRTEAVTQPLVRAGNPAHCPLGALAAWRVHLTAVLGRRFTSALPMFPRLRRGGAIGRTAIVPATVGEVLRRRLDAAGIPSAGFTAHSLRAGMLTSAAFNGASTWRLMEHSRHKRTDTLAAYIRDARALASHPAEGLL